jgi:hypothetical protein
VAALSSLTALAVAPALASGNAKWRPEPARYGVHTTKNVAIEMRDGTVLRANVLVPTDPKTGKPARGPFPVLMVQTPYGKDTVGAASGGEGGAEAATQAGPLPYFVNRPRSSPAAPTGCSGGRARPPTSRSRSRARVPSAPAQSAAEALRRSAYGIRETFESMISLI